MEFFIILGILIMLAAIINAQDNRIGFLRTDNIKLRLELSKNQLINHIHEQENPNG